MDKIPRFKLSLRLPVLLLLRILFATRDADSATLNEAGSIALGNAVVDSTGAGNYAR